MNTILNTSPVLLFIGLLLLNILSVGLGTVKTILISKQAGLPAILLATIDGAVYVLILKSISMGEGYIAAITYILGRIIGVALGDKIENALAIGIYEIKIYLNNENKIQLINDYCIKNDYSLTIVEGKTPYNDKRYILTIQCDRKAKKGLIDGLNNLGIKELTMSINELKSTSGKIMTKKR